MADRTTQFNRPDALRDFTKFVWSLDHMLTKYLDYINTSAYYELGIMGTNDPDLFVDFFILAELGDILMLPGDGQG